MEILPCLRWIFGFFLAIFVIEIVFCSGGFGWKANTIGAKVGEEWLGERNETSFWGKGFVSGEALEDITYAFLH